MSILNLFKWTYYFDDNLAMTFLGWGYWVIVGSLGLGIVAAIVVPRVTKKLPFLPRQIILHSAALAMLVGWLGLLWLFFRYEGLRYLSWRLWPAILLVYALVRIGLMIKFAWVDFPKRRTSKISGREKEKYLQRYMEGRR